MRHCLPGRASLHVFGSCRNTMTEGHTSGTWIARLGASRWSSTVRA